jgi:hypothetical protein
MRSNMKRIKNQKRHEDLLSALESVRGLYNKVSKDDMARAMSAILNVVVASGEFSVEQTRRGVSFNNTEIGQLSCCILNYLNEHPILTDVDGLLGFAEEVANSDIEEEE